MTTNFVTNNAEYRATPSVRRYVVLPGPRPPPRSSRARGEDWITDLLAGDAAILRMPEMGVEIPLSEIYRRVEFEAEAGEGEQRRVL